MRMYFFGNMYLSPIQQGIQAAHVTADMFIKYADVHNIQRNRLYEWATDHKTMILLNAGFGAEILDLHEFFNNVDNTFPFEIFHEEEATLNNAATSIGIVLPEYIYKLSSMLRGNQISQSVIDTLTYDNADIFRGFEDILMANELFDRLAEASTFERQLIGRLNKYGLA